MVKYHNKANKEELREWFLEAVGWLMERGIFDSRAKMADALSIPPSTITDIDKGRIGVSRAVERKMRDYLKTLNSEINETAPPYLKAASEMENGYAEIQLIPVYLIKATADQIDFQKSTQRIAMPNVSFSDRIMAVKMWGNFLAPQYTTDDYIAIQQLTDTNILQYGMPHIVRTKEQLIPRLLMPAEDDDHFLLKSTNERQFPDLLIPKEKVTDLYLIIDKARQTGT